MVPGRRNEQQQCLFHMLHNSCLLDYCTILKFIIRNSDSSQASCIQMTFEYCLWFRLLQIFSPGVIFQMWSKRRWGMQDEQQTKVHLRNSGNSSSPYVFLYSDITCHITRFEIGIFVVALLDTISMDITNLMWPYCRQRNVTFEFTEHRQSNILGVTPPEGRGADRLTVDSAHTVWQTMTTGFPWVRVSAFICKLNSKICCLEPAPPSIIADKNICVCQGSHMFVSNIMYIRSRLEVDGGRVITTDLPLVG